MFQVILREGITTGEIMWLDWSSGNMPDRAVVAGVEGNSFSFSYSRNQQLRDRENSRTVGAVLCGMGIVPTHL